MHLATSSPTNASGTTAVVGSASARVATTVARRRDGQAVFHSSGLLFLSQSKSEGGGRFSLSTTAEVVKSRQASTSVRTWASSVSSSGRSPMATSGEAKPDAEIKVYGSGSELGNELAAYVAELSAAAVKERGVFSVVLSGGSLISTLNKLVEEPHLSHIDWSKWHVFWADERVVKLDHPDSNYKLAQDGLLSKVLIPPEQVHAINDALAPKEAAEDYEARLKHLVAAQTLPLLEIYPRFDLILLGMGPDAHVASLFPNHPLVHVKDKWVASITDSPKPPPERITLTFPVINAAANIAFVATGAGKADKVKSIFQDKEVPYGALPAQIVSPVAGKLVWFADEAATSKL